MATQQFFDRYSSTLASGYTSGGTSLSVTSASGLPSAGDFYVTVEAEGANTEEVFKITSRSGTTLTCVGAQAQTSASNHASGATIKGFTLTKDALEGMKRDTVASLTVSAFNALSGNGGYQHVRLSDGVYECIWNGSSWDYYFQHFKCTPVAVGDLTWVNQSTNGSANNDRKALTLTCDAVASGEDVKILKKAAPGSTPYTLTIGICFTESLANHSHVGIVHRNSSTGKLILWGPGNDSNNISYIGYNSPTSFSGTQAQLGAKAYSSPIWLRLTDDGTNRKMYFSLDGFNYSKGHSVARTDVDTMDEYGIAVRGSSTDKTHMLCFHFLES